MGYFNRAARKLRARLLSPASREIAALDKEVAGLREEIARLHAVQASSGLDGLRHRVGQLESLLTEHPNAGSRGLTKLPFSSPVLSIVMPTWNRANVIADAIRSVQAQFFTDWELIIVDDGSTDDTAGIVALFSDDKRIRCFKQPHAGPSQARNRGLALGRGALIAYLDSDNLWYPGFLAAAVTAFATDPTIDSAYGALISEDHGEDERILFKPFDRARLLKGNFLDLNTFVHRRALFEKHGGFDETLDRFLDWDLVLRYTQDAPSRRLPVLAARYRVVDEHRISNETNCGLNHFRISRKWNKPPALAKPIRVLYVLWHYPQLSETYVETEILCMKRWGVHVEVWSGVGVGSPYESSVPIHRGSLTEAIAAARPDILHVHWVNIANERGAEMIASGLPVTVRAHGFEVTADAIRQLLALPTLKRAFFFPHQMSAFTNEPRLKPILAAFDTSLFTPEPNKDRRLVIRTSAGLPSKELPLFFDVAKRLPDHRFILAVVTCKDMESYIPKLTAELQQSGAPVELMNDVSREKLAPSMRQAAFYLHTALPPDCGGTPLGMPISIAEAMGTGAHVLVRDLREFTSYVGPAGSGYRDAEHAAKIISEISALPEGKWKKTWIESVDRAYLNFADENVLRPLFDEWCDILQRK